jgi:hypothetical protein
VNITDQRQHLNLLFTRNIAIRFSRPIEVGNDDTGEGADRGELGRFQLALGRERHERRHRLVVGGAPAQTFAAPRVCASSLEHGKARWFEKDDGRTGVAVVRQDLEERVQMSRADSRSAKSNRGRPQHVCGGTMT